LISLHFVRSEPNLQFPRSVKEGKTTSMLPMRLKKSLRKENSEKEEERVSERPNEKKRVEEKKESSRVGESLVNL